MLQLGTGVDVSIGELVELIGALVGRDLVVELDPQRVRPAESEVPRLQCDHSLVSSLTGWEPTVDLRAGLGHTLRWLEANRHRYRATEYAR